MQSVNNDVYEQLGERWYTAKDDPIALLRAESSLRNPWIASELASRVGSSTARVLDVGCGGGFLANYLARAGHRVVGFDASADALRIAERYDTTGRVDYQQGDALHLPFADASFDAVCAMDFLEHVVAPERVIAEAARVLKPSGVFFFHTFNRTFLSWLIVIKGVEWFVSNTPRHLHVLHQFITPSELRAACTQHGLGRVSLQGMRPKIGKAFFQMLLTGCVPADFAFAFTGSTGLGYTGLAVKEGGDGGDVQLPA